MVLPSGDKTEIQTNQGLLARLTAQDARALSRWHVHGGIKARIAKAGYYLGLGTVQIPGLLALWALAWGMGWGQLKAAAGYSLLAFLAGGLAAQLIKHLVGRPRPRVYLATGRYRLGPSLKEGLDSFPSGHTTSTMAQAVLLCQLYPQAAPVFFALALFVAVARLMGGSHFPLDVLGGMVIGAAAGWWLAPLALAHFPGV